MSGTYRINSMDALRAMAILLVLLAHAVLGFGAPDSIAPLQLGGIGVDLFFVLSGWLLGSLLFKEMSQGSIDVRRFWIRRWMRTLPAYYTVLTLTILQQVLTKENPAIRLDYYVFLQNYSDSLPIFSVSWSLAVEEQFYLFIAPALLFLSRFSRHVRLGALLILLAVPSVFRMLGWFDNLEQTHVRLDGCVMGVLLACIRYDFAPVWQRLTHYSGLLFGIALLAFLASFFQRWYPNDYFGDPGILARALIFGCWIVFANANQVVAQGFYFPGAHYIATRSYSMYLLHPEAIALLNRVGLDLPFVVYFSIMFVLTLLISELLYRFVEMPVMRLRDRLPMSS